MTNDLHLDRVKNIPTSGWLVVAISAVVGAIGLETHRLLGAVLGAGAAFAYALSEAPCCDGCAKGQGCGETAATGNQVSLIGGFEKSTSGRVLQAKPSTNAFSTSDHIDLTGASSGLDPTTLWSSGQVSDSTSSPSSPSSGCTGCS